MREKFGDFATVENVVAAGEYVNAGIEQFLCEARRDAEPGGSVFAIGNHQIDALRFDQIGEAVVNDLAAGRAADVSDEEDTHVREDKRVRGEGQRGQAGRDKLCPDRLGAKTCRDTIRPGSTNHLLTVLAGGRACPR